MKHNEHLKLVGTCDGIRGMAMGFIKAGYNEVLSSDFWEKPRDVFEANLPANRPGADPDHYCISKGEYLAGKKADLFMLNFSDLNDYLLSQGKNTVQVGETACLIAGTVCKDMSAVNTTKRHPFGRFNYLMMRQIDLIKQVMPMVAVMEQVPGFNDTKMQPFRNEFWNYCRRISGDYHISCQLMNAMHYGARQDRDRLIFLFVRKDLGTLPSYPEPVPVDPSQYVGNLLPHIKGFKNGGKFIRADRLMSTMTSGSIYVKLVEGGTRQMTIEERKVLCNLENLVTDIPGLSIRDLHVMMGNMVQIPFMEAIAKHIRTHILKV